MCDVSAIVQARGAGNSLLSSKVEAAKAGSLEVWAAATFVPARRFSGRSECDGPAFAGPHPMGMITV
jgi:hypothetical protein